MTGRDVPADDRLREALLTHHPIMRSETGPLSGCRCGAVGIGQDVIALLSVVRAYGDLRAAEELRAAAKDIPRFSPAVIAKWLRDRAAVLTAREEAGR